MLPSPETEPTVDGLVNYQEQTIEHSHYHKGLHSLCTNSHFFPFQTNQKGKVAFTSTVIINCFLAQIFKTKKQNARNT